nr:MAG TPA: hypothetical protein [Caudoviricetes sp.]
MQRQPLSVFFALPHQFAIVGFRDSLHCSRIVFQQHRQVFRVECIGKCPASNDFHQKISGGFAFHFLQIRQFFEWLVIECERQHAILIAGSGDRDIGLKCWFGLKSEFGRHRYLLTKKSLRDGRHGMVKALTGQAAASVTL